MKMPNDVQIGNDFSCIGFKEALGSSQVVSPLSGFQLAFGRITIQTHDARRNQTDISILIQERKIW